jgi:DNA-binding NtrC family response regulator
MTRGPTHKNRRLLIVDDDPALRRMLTWAFLDLGYQVSAVSDYDSALFAISQKDFDCALLDYHLPDGTGDNLMRKAHEIQPDLAVILMSGNISRQQSETAISDGALEFLVKPISVSSIHQTFSNNDLSSP